MRIKLLLFLLLGIFAVSCNDDNAVSGSDGVTFILSSSDTRSEVESFSDGDAIGIFAVDKSVSSTLLGAGNLYDNVKYIWSTNKKAFIASSSSPTIYNYDNKVIDFYIYYPYSASITDATKISHIISGISAEDDFLYAKSSGRGQTLPLRFKHLLSKVKVNYIPEEITDNIAMSVNTYTGMNINLSSGSVATVKNVRSAIKLEKSVSGKNISFTGLIPPQTYIQGEKFGEIVGADYPFSFSKDRIFVSGEINEVTFMPKKPAYVFSVSPLSISGSALDTNTYPFSVSSTRSSAINGTKLPGTTSVIGYSILEKPDWVSIKGSSASFSENTGVSTRSGTVTFKQVESGYTTSLLINQSAAVISDKYIFNFSDGSTSAALSDISALGSSKTISIVSSKEKIVNGNVTSTEPIGYSSHSSVSWISVTGTSITVSENTSTSARSGIITFTQEASKKNIEVTVSQSAGSLTYDYTFTLSDGSTAATWSGVNASGSTKTYSIISKRKEFMNGGLVVTNDFGYSSHSSVTWISVTGTSLSVSENTSTSARSGIITFTQETSKKNIKVTVSQSAGVINVEYGNWTTNSLSVSASPNPVSASGGTASLSCTASQSRPKYIKANGVITSTVNETQTISVTPSWSKVSGSGSVNGSTVTFLNNTTTSALSGTYRASFAAKTKDIIVSQSAGSLTYDYTFTLNDGSTTATWSGVSAGGSTKTYSFISKRKVFANGALIRTEDVGYISSSNVTWASVSGGKITISKNPTTSPRGGVINFYQSGSGKSIKVTVLQLKSNSVEVDE